MKRLLFGFLLMFPSLAFAGSKIKCPTIVDPRDQQILTGLSCYSSRAAAKKAGYVPAASSLHFIYFTGFTSNAFTISGAPRKFLFTAVYSGTHFSAQILRASDGAELGLLMDDSSDGFRSAGASIEIPNEAIKIVFDSDSYFCLDIH